MGICLLELFVNACIEACKLLNILLPVNSAHELILLVRIFCGLGGEKKKKYIYVHTYFFLKAPSL